MSKDVKCEPHVVIVGAGIAGIAAAISLKTKLYFDNFTVHIHYSVGDRSTYLPHFSQIYEQADAVGGTWRDSTYPGCGSDVPGHWYSLSTDLNPRWRSYYANQPELRAYWEDLWHKYDLVRHTVLSTTVVTSTWSNDTSRYTVSVENLKTGERSEVEAEAIFYALGGFQGPLYPKDILGVDRFQGELFHTARWRHDVLLQEKRVGVIGNGCSAAQLIPEISKDPSVQVVNFCRTPQWYIPRGNFRYPQWLQWMFAHIPFLMRIYRNLIMAKSDILFLIFRKNNKRLLAIVRKTLTTYIKRKAPKEHLVNLIPDYAPGCKRIIVDPGYLESLNRPNVSLKWDAIETIVEDGIKLKTGEIVPLDVIIFATGYSLEPAQLQLRGSRGETIHEYFASKGGPTAYLGSYVPGFPNAFLLLGPNVASGHASVIFSEEMQINLAIHLLKPVLEGKAKSFEVTDGATDKYNDWLQSRLQTSVWTDCASYYQAGRDSKTRIIATFPGPVSLFWWLCRRPRWEMFHGVGAEAWERERRLSQVRNWSIATVLAAGMGILLNGV